MEVEKVFWPIGIESQAVWKDMSWNCFEAMWQALHFRNKTNKAIMQTVLIDPVYYCL
jgi:hypothetical protein